MSSTTTSTTKGNVTTTETKPDKPKPVKGKLDVNGDGEVNALDDLNNDGRADKKDRVLRQDTLSMGYLQENYAVAARIVGANAELKKIFDDAIKGGWTPEMFQSALQNSKWHTDQGTEFARKAWLARAKGGEEWEEQLSAARNTVQRQAASMGADLSEDELEDFTERYLFNGWFEPSRQGLMLDALSSSIDIKKGGAARVSGELRALALNNGVGITDEWMKEVATSIARGQSTQQEYEDWIREQAANRYPMYADKIRAGVSVKALASPYLQRMQDILEVPEEQVSLNDKYIAEALGKVNEKGEQVAMSFTEFENKLRSDPRWEQTKNGSNTLMNMAENFTRKMGFSIG